MKFVKSQFGPPSAMVQRFRKSARGHIQTFSKTQENDITESIGHNLPVSWGSPHSLSHIPKPEAYAIPFVKQDETFLLKARSLAKQMD